MAGLGWFDMHRSPCLDQGDFELPCLPLRLNPSGCVARKLEPDRYRRTTEGGGPRPRRHDSKRRPHSRVEPELLLRE